MIDNTDYVSSWKSKGLSAESIKPPTASDNSLTPALDYYGTKTRVKFTASCLQQRKVSYTHGTIVNIYIVYELGASSSLSLSLCLCLSICLCLWLCLCLCLSPSISLSISLSLSLSLSYLSMVKKITNLKQKALKL